MSQPLSERRCRARPATNVLQLESASLLERLYINVEEDAPRKMRIHAKVGGEEDVSGMVMLVVKPFANTALVHVYNTALAFN